MEVTTIIAFALVAAVLTIIVHQFKPEYEIFIVIAAGASLLLMIVSYTYPVLNDISEMLNNAGIDSKYFAVLLKALGICYITQFAGDICRDAGQTSLAAKIDMAGKVAIIILALPILKNLIAILTDIIK